MERTIEKSRFIGYVCPISMEDEAVAFIEKIKKKHWDATHNVPVYVLGDNYHIQKYSDDGEPSGTAGVPILEMLKKEGITNVCIVITRYFGGIKLGTGGLVRAYTQSAKDALEAGIVVDKQVNTILCVAFDYHHHGKVQNALIHDEDVIINASRFSDIIEMDLYVKPEKEQEICTQLIELTSGSVKIENKGECLLTLCEGTPVNSN
jgi:uncharacterized YigZ family protein